MFIDDVRAKSLSRQRLAEWIEEGRKLRSHLRRIGSEAVRDLSHGRPPKKTIGELQKRFAQLLESPWSLGTLETITSRRTSIEFFAPRAESDGFGLTRVFGELNGRTGALNLFEEESLEVSFHAICRLHERLGAIDARSVLREILAAVPKDSMIRECAREFGGKSWPICTPNGIFVATANDSYERTTLITWMRTSAQSSRLSTLAASIRALEGDHPSPLADPTFYREFLRLHRWPIFRVAGMQDADSIEGHPTGGTIHSPMGLNEWDTRFKLKVGERIGARVLGRRKGSSVLVVLDTGLWASIPGVDVRALEAGRPDAFRVGSRVEVEVVRIKFIKPQRGVLITVNDAELAARSWADVVLRHPIGMRTTGKVLKVGTHMSVLQLTDGPLAVLNHADLAWSESSEEAARHLRPGDLLTVCVKAVSSLRRRMIVSRRDAQSHPLDTPAARPKSGDKLRAVATKKTAFGYFVKLLPSRIDALLHSNNVPDHFSLQEGAEFMCEVLRVDVETRRVQIGLADTSVYGFVNTSSSTPEAVRNFLALHPVGSTVSGAVRRLFPEHALLQLPDGILGCLRSEHIAWSHPADPSTLLNVGDEIEVRVLSATKSHVLVSRRDCLPHPLERPGTVRIGALYAGEVAKVVDYGAFVRLPLGINGLLHKNALGSQEFVAGDRLIVRVCSVDEQRRRVGLELPHGNSPSPHEAVPNRLS